jgi:uncharacterized membrane protein YfcA
MTVFDIWTLGMAIGLTACGLFFAWLLRHSPFKTLSIVLLTAGLLLLTCGQLQRHARHESEDIKAARFERPILAGWLMTGTALAGLLQRNRRAARN